MAPEESLEALRQRASDLFNDSDYGAYLETVPGLGTDLGGYWLALAGYAAWRIGRDDVTLWLERSISAGFAQPEMIPEDIAGFEGWSECAQRMRQNLPRPWVTLKHFPEFNTDVPLWTRALSFERESRLLERLPAPAGTAWDTALELLAWVQRQWRHDGNNDPGNVDALELLKRSAEGERFRCVEYGVVLEAALNARGIPARTCGLRMPDYHAGSGRGHVTVEAWIDDLSAWVVLDGQNGGYWSLEDQPLGARALCELFWSGAEAPEFVNLNDAPLDAALRRLWFPYFAYTQSGQGAWLAPGVAFTPQFQTRFAINATRVSRDPGRLWPDLSGFDTGFERLNDKPALRLHSPHPHCQGFRVNGSSFSGNPAVVNLEPFMGTSRLEVRAYTAYGLLKPASLELEWS